MAKTFIIRVAGEGEDYQVVVTDGKAYGFTTEDHEKMEDDLYELDLGLREFLGVEVNG